MNWGKGIIIVMSAFVIFILTLVFILMNNRVDLTSEDYYKKEIGFQVEINALKAGETFSSKLIINQDKDSIFLSFRDSCPSQIGTVDFIRPSDVKLDKTFIWKGERLNIPKQIFRKGLYKLQFNFRKTNQTIRIDNQIIIE